MMDTESGRRSEGLPQWYLDAESRIRTGIRNPGRRGIAADLYSPAARLPLETPFLQNPEYRRLRYAFDKTEERVARLTAVGASSRRIAAARTAENAASAALAGFLIRHLQEGESQVPVVLRREMDADGVLVSETVVGAESTPQ